MRERIRKMVKFMGWDKNSVVRQKEWRIIVVMTIKEHTKQAMHNVISHHLVTDDLSSEPPAPGQLSPVYMLSVIL